jgi:hypothetical protein
MFGNDTDDIDGDRWDEFILKQSHHVSETTAVSEDAHNSRIVPQLRILLLRIYSS